MLEWLRSGLIVVVLAGLAISVADVAVVRGLAAYDVGMRPVVGTQSTVVATNDAKHLGIAAGDRLRLLDADVAHRLRVEPPGGTATVRDEKTSRVLVLHSRGDRYGEHISPTRLSARVLRVLIVALALLLLIVRGKKPEGLALAAFLFFNAFFTLVISDGGLGTGWRAGYDALTGVCISAEGFALIALIVILSTPTRPVRWLLRIAAGAALLNAVYQVAGITVLASTGYLLPWVDGVESGGQTSVVLLCFAVVALVMGIATTHGLERRRLIIVGVSVMFGLLADTFAVPFAGSFTLYSTAQSVVSELMKLIMAAGLTYAVFHERLFDIGFVINRAVVFGVLSAIIVLVFIMVEWVVGKWAGSNGRAQGATVEVVLAVIIGLSLRPLHRRVDDFVDHVLFAHRHRAANAIAQFARDVHLVEKREAALAALDATLRAFARVSSYTILLGDESGVLRKVSGTAAEPLELDCDDVVAIRMRTVHKVVERASFPLLQFADYAFPMLVRGRVTGVIGCTLPHRVDPYSPEEVDALALVARETGLALVALDAAATQRLREENLELRHENGQLRRDLLLKK